MQPTAILPVMTNKRDYMIATGSRVAARLAVVLACHVGVVMGLPDAAAAEERQLFMLVMN